MGGVAIAVVVGIGLVVVVDGGEDDDDTPPAPAPTLPTFVDGAPKRALEPAFVRAARENDLPVALVMALAWRESQWRAEALNPTSGAIGIGQLLPATATFVATQLLGDPTLDPADPRDNIRMTARYVRALTDRFDGSTRLALAAYLQGSTPVANDGVSDTTAAYLRDIDEIRERFEAARRGDAGSALDPLGD